MADISMCSGERCPLKNKCYRHTAVKNEYWQSWLGEVLYDKETKSCEHFWDNRKRRKAKINLHTSQSFPIFTEK